jgi:micrococcal nuclease
MIEQLYTYSANLVRVVDGDTFVADIDLGFDTWIKGQSVRILGINAPEIKTKKGCLSTKESGLASKKFLEDTIAGQNLIVQSTQRDSFGRILAKVRFGESQIDLAEFLLAANTCQAAVGRSAQGQKQAF